MKLAVVVCVCGFWLCCASGPRDEAAPRSEPVVGAPAVSDPLKQGFTQNPDPDTPGLPSPIPPFLNEMEREAALTLAAEVSDADVARARRELEELVEAFERDPTTELIDSLRQKAHELARRGLVVHATTDTLYSDYLFPNTEADADARYKNGFVVLTGRIAPANMRDFADGFKLIEQNPYVHDPMLLATDYELSFVECSLAHPQFQLLRDWQPVHFIAQVEGKRTSDLILRRCIVL